MRKRILSVILSLFMLLSFALADRVWESRMPFPSSSEINAYNQRSTERAPYIMGWMDTDQLGRYSEFAIEFKADYVPAGTYCSLFNFYIDYSSLKSQYAEIVPDTEGISGYAGVQQGGAHDKPNAILSFWDVYCKDQNGKIVKTLRPRLIEPAGETAPEFGNEGTGVHYLPRYDWKPGRWYLMLMQIGAAEGSGNTTVQQWFRDMETGYWTKICEYDLGAPNLTFIGPVCIFLECFSTGTAGNIRTLEFRNIRVRKENREEWISIRSGTFDNCFDWPGSYQFGTSGDTFWMISSGITGLIQQPRKHLQLRVDGGSTSNPY